MRDIKPGGTKGHTERFGQENSHDDKHDHFLGRAVGCHCAVWEGIGKATDGLLVDSYWILPRIETGLIEKSQMTNTMTNTNHAVDSRSDPSLFVAFMYTAFPRPKTTTPNTKKSQKHLHNSPTTLFFSENLIFKLVGAIQFFWVYWFDVAWIVYAWNLKIHKNDKSVCFATINSGG